MTGIYIHPSVWKPTIILGSAAIGFGVVTFVLGIPIYISMPCTLVLGYVVGRLGLV